MKSLRKIDFNSRFFIKYMIVRNGEHIIKRGLNSEHYAYAIIQNYYKHSMIGADDEVEVIRYSFPNPNYQGVDPKIEIYQFKEL